MNLEVICTTILSVASFVAGICPHDKMQSNGICSFRIQCYEDIKGINLPPTCTESTNEQVNVDVTLFNAIEHFGSQSDPHFLSSITTLRIYGKWPNTTLTPLENTIQLENLLLNNSNIETITGKPFFYLNSLSLLDLSYNKLSEIDHLFKFELQPNLLKKLFLSNNRIRNVAANAFDELTSLVELDLSYNFISDLTVAPFSRLTSLEVLNLNNNSIIDLNDSVNNLHSLKHLYLKGNCIENIEEESLKIIKHLETFDVSRNYLKEVKSIIFLKHWEHLNVPTVFKIFISDNRIMSLPNTTAREVGTKIARHLTTGRDYGEMFTELDLSDNDISNIEFNAFQSLIKLISLNLSTNKVIDFIVNSHDLAYVRHLNLSKNYISHLYPETFSEMRFLEILDLSYNRMDYIPGQTFLKNYNLRRVNLTFNSIKTLDDLNINLLHLNGGILDLSNNNISSLKIPYGDHSHLTYLLLHSNNISDPSIIDLQLQTDLKTLDMSRNQIRNLNEKSFRLLPVSLSFLDLRCNDIDSIAPSTFFHVGHLETLLLSHNRLKTIEYGSFRGLSSLESLDLSYNRIETLNSKLLMDLKSLSLLHLGYNGIQVISDEGWYGHGRDLKVYLDGNNLSCEWLASAIKNHDRGFSKMRPTVVSHDISGPTIDGIHCTPDDTTKARLQAPSSVVLADERLLLITQKLLEAVKEQTYYLKKYVWHSIQDDANKVIFN